MRAMILGRAERRPATISSGSQSHRFTPYTLGISGQQTEPGIQSSVPTARDSDYRHPEGH